MYLCVLLVACMLSAALDHRSRIRRAPGNRGRDVLLYRSLPLSIYFAYGFVVVLMPPNRDMFLSILPFILVIHLCFRISWSREKHKRWQDGKLPLPTGMKIVPREHILVRTVGRDDGDMTAYARDPNGHLLQAICSGRLYPAVTGYRYGQEWSLPLGKSVTVWARRSPTSQPCLLCITNRKGHCRVRKVRALQSDRSIVP